jgi:hypothetical protein
MNLTGSVSAVGCMPLLCGPFDSISQPALRPLAITHLASDVQNSNSLRSSITPGITRRPTPVKEYEKQRVGGRVHAVVMVQRNHCRRSRPTIEKLSAFAERS